MPRCQFISRGTIRCNQKATVTVSSDDVAAAVVEFDEQYFTSLDPSDNVTVEGGRLCAQHGHLVETTAAWTRELIGA